MHTESLFKSDESFLAFMNERRSDLKCGEKSSDGETQIVYLVDDPCRLCVANELFSYGGSRYFRDTIVLPMECAKSIPRTLCHVSPAKSVGDMRRFVELKSPVFHNTYTAIDIFATLGIDGDAKPYSVRSCYAVHVVGLALSLRRRTDDVVMTVTKGPHLEYTRHYEKDFKDDCLEYDLYSMTSFVSIDEPKGPECYEFHGVIDGVDSFEWYGLKLHRLSMRLHTADDRLPFYYSIVVSESVLNGYRPRIGESIAGMMALCLTSARELSAKNDDAQFFKEVCADVKARTASEKGRAKKARDVTEKKEYPWGTVTLVDGKDVSFEPNKDYPVESSMGAMPLRLPTKKEKGPVSKFEAETLQYFCFPDAFALQVHEMEFFLCAGKRSEVNDVLRQIKTKRGMEWNTTRGRDNVGVFQAAETKDRAIVFYHLRVRPDLSPVNASLMALYDRREKKVLSYTVTGKTAINMHPGLSLCDAHSLSEGKHLPIWSVDEAKAYLPEMEPDEFIILENRMTETYIQFFRNEEDFQLEFQLGDIAWHFETKVKSADDVRKAIELFESESDEFYAAFKWKHTT